MFFKRYTSLLVTTSLLVQSISPAFAVDPKKIEDIEDNLDEIRKYKSVPASRDFQSHPNKTAAGVLHWAKKDGKAYILLGRRNDGGKWCNFGGLSDVEKPAVELPEAKQLKPELLVGTAVREVGEESNKLYATHPRLMRNNPFTAVYMPKEWEGLLYYMFWEQVQHLSPEIFMKKMNEASAAHNKEYSDFVWVEASDICNAVSSKTSNLRLNGKDIEIFGPLFATLSTESGKAFLKDLTDNNCIQKFKNRKLHNRLYVIDNVDNSDKKHKESVVHWDVPTPNWVAKNAQGKWVPNLSEKWWFVEGTGIPRIDDPRVHTLVPFGKDAFGRETGQAAKEKNIFAEAVAAHAMAMVQIKRRNHVEEPLQATLTENWNPNAEETLSRIHLRGVLGKEYKSPDNPTDRTQRRAADIENIKSYFKLYQSSHYRMINLLASDFDFFANILEAETENKAWPTFYHGATAHINSLYKSFTYTRELIDVRSLKNLIVLRGTDIYFKDDNTIWSMLERLGTDQSLTSNAMIFLNFVLFAGLRTTISASSSPEYVINNHNVAPPNIEKKFEEGLVLAGFENPIYDYFHSLFQQFIEFKNPTTSNSVMYTISQNPEDLDDHNYPCHPGGHYCPDNKSTLKVHGDIQKEFENQQKDDHKAFDEKGYQEQLSFKNLFPENRLFLHPTRVMDSTKTIIKAFDRFPLSKEEEELYDQEMRHTTVAMLADWLAQETCVIDGSLVKYPVLKTLYKKIYKGLIGEDLIERPFYEAFITLLINNHAGAASTLLELFPEILTKVDLTPLLKSTDQDIRLSLVKVLLPNEKKLPPNLVIWFENQIKEIIAKPLNSAIVQDEILFRYILDKSTHLRWGENYMDGSSEQMMIKVLGKNKSLNSLFIPDSSLDRIMDSLFKGEDHDYLDAPWFKALSGHSKLWIDEEAARSLAEAIGKNTTMTHLNLGNCYILDYLVPILAEGFKQNTSLREVILPGKILSSVKERIGVDTPSTHAPWLQETVQGYLADPIKIIQFDLKEKRWDHLTETLRTTTVDELDLTRIQEYEIMPCRDSIIAGLQGNSTLKTVKMHDQDRGQVVTELMSMASGPFTTAPWFVEARENVIQNPEDFLKLSVKQRYSPGVLLILRESPQEIVLKDFTGSTLWSHPFWMDDLIQGLGRDENYTHLNLSGIDFVGDDFDKFCTALQANTKLKTLNMSDCKIGSEKTKVLADALKNNKTLEKLTLSLDKLVSVLDHLESFEEGAFRQAPWYPQAWQEVCGQPQEFMKIAQQQRTYSLIEHFTRKSKVDTLNLNLLEFPYTWVTPVLAGLKANRTIKHLVVPQSAFDNTKQMRDLLQVLNVHPSVEKLEFWGRDKFCAETLSVLAQEVQNAQGLQELIVSDKLQVLNALYPNRESYPKGVQAWVERGMSDLRSHKSGNLWSTLYYGFENLTAFLTANETEFKLEGIGPGLVDPVCSLIRSNNELTHVDLQFSSSSYYGESPLPQLVVSLRELAELRSVRLGYPIRLTQASVQDMCSVFAENQNLRTLDLSGSELEQNAVSVLAEYQQKYPLTEIVLCAKNQLDMLNEHLRIKEQLESQKQKLVEDKVRELCENTEANLIDAIETGHTHLALALLETGKVENLDLSEVYHYKEGIASLAVILKKDRHLKSFILSDSQCSVLPELYPARDTLSTGVRTWVEKKHEALMKDPGGSVKAALYYPVLAQWVLNQVESITLTDMDRYDIDKFSKIIKDNKTVKKITLVGEFWNVEDLSNLFMMIKDNPNTIVEKIDASRCVFKQSRSCPYSLTSLQKSKPYIQIDLPPGAIEVSVN